MTTAVIAKTRELKRSGKTIAEISEELGVNKHTVQYYCRGIPATSKKYLTDEQKRKLMSFWSRVKVTLKSGAFWG